MLRLMDCHSVLPGRLHQPHYQTAVVLSIQNLDMMLLVMDCHILRPGR